MKTEGKQIVELVKENKMLDAKKIFQSAMDKKMASVVTQMRETVAKSVFGKK